MVKAMASNPMVSPWSFITTSVTTSASLSETSGLVDDYISCSSEEVLLEKQPRSLNSVAHGLAFSNAASSSSLLKKFLHACPALNNQPNVHGDLPRKPLLCCEWCRPPRTSDMARPRMRSRSASPRSKSRPGNGGARAGQVRERRRRRSAYQDPHRWGCCHGPSYAMRKIVLSYICQVVACCFDGWHSCLHAGSLRI